MYKMGLEHLVFENKELLKMTGMCHKDIRAIWKDLLLESVII